MWQGVLFDLGDTLVDNHPFEPAQRDEQIARDLEVWLRRRSMRSGDDFTPDERAQLGEVDGGPLVAAVNQSLADVAEMHWSAGREATPDEVFGRLRAEIAAATGLVASAAELEEVYVRARMAKQRVLPGAHELLASLRRAGVRCGLVSNTAFSREAMDTYLRTHGLASALDAVIYSSEVGWRKPRPQIFRAALLRLGVAAAKTVFVGDHPQADVGGAIAFGLSAVWFWGNNPAAERAPVAVSGEVPLGGDGRPLPGTWPSAAGDPTLAGMIAQLAEAARTGRLLGAARTLEQTGELLLPRQ